MTEKTLKLIELIREYTYLKEGAPDENNVRQSELSAIEPDKFYEAIEVFIFENEETEDFKKRKLLKFKTMVNQLEFFKVLPEKIARNFRSEIETIKFNNLNPPKNA